MLTPAYPITATERVLPNLALDFTTSVLDSRVAVARANNTATTTDSSGVIVAVNANLPRFDFDPVTLACRGLLIEEARTNLLLNSLLNGTSLATQTVTVTAAAHTLSFYGTGSVVLSGAHSATVNGSGAYPTRTTLTFTPTAGSLTLTVSGTVQFANLELGAFATSFIPTDGTTKTRSADNPTVTGTNFSSWYVAGGTLTAQASTMNTSAERVAVNISNGSSGTRAFELAFLSTGNRGLVVNSSVQASLQQTPVAASAKYAMVSKVNDFALSVNGNAVLTDTAGTVPTVSAMWIGSSINSAAWLNGHVQKIAYYPQRLTNAELQAFSK
jgi:hypothetical protein